MEQKSKHHLVLTVLIFVLVETILGVGTGLISNSLLPITSYTHMMLILSTHVNNGTFILFIGGEIIPVSTMYRAWFTKSKTLSYILVFFSIIILRTSWNPIPFIVVTNVTFFGFAIRIISFVWFTHINICFVRGECKQETRPSSFSKTDS